VLLRPARSIDLSIFLYSPHIISGLAISRLYSELSRLIAKPPTTLLSNNHDRAITIGGSTMRQAPTRTFDQALVSAWHDELKATRNPSIKHQCLQQQGELLPRFAMHYQELKALPRRLRRSLQRQWKRSLGGLALLLALGQAPLLAATINVGGTCTLVRAINAANNGTTASGHCRKGSGADTIVLPKDST
jgi:hypothetical protein